MLIIGDRKTARPAVADRHQRNPKGQDLTCIYVAIARRASS